MPSGPRAVLFVIVLAAVCVASCVTPRAEPRAGLGGTWTAVEVAGLAPKPLTAPRVQFLSDGRIQGATGCGDFTGEVLIVDDRIEFRGFTTTVGACAADIRAVETAFVSALTSAVTISGGTAEGRLVLSGPVGDIVFVQPAP